uniref:Lysozyme n=1 Tax=Meloidogyne javanica TaxID=6303 RepID=A0A915N0M7_MELJA
MSADENKLIRKNVSYNRSWIFSSTDFEKWKRRFDKAKKNWQKKYTRDSFIWYNHNCIRKKKKCKYSKSEDNSCRGKMKIPEKPEGDKFGFYRIELTDDGFEHFVSEFEEEDDDYGNFIFEFFKEFNSNNTVNEVTGNFFKDGDLGLIIKLFYPATSGSSSLVGQSQSDEEKKMWDELSKRLMKSVQISAPVRAPPARTHPPEVISVSEDNDRIQWERLRSNNPNIKMVIARCSIGLNLDKEFYYNYRSMISVKFLQIGVYHHFLGGQNSPTPNEQLQFLKDILGNIEFNKKKHLIGIAVQTEYNADADPLTFTAKLSIFVNLLLKNDFMRPLIYCNNNSWEKLIDPTVADELFSRLPLWIARYTDDPFPQYPETWKSRGIKWWLWQYSELGVVDGIINHVHYNRRNKFYFIQDDMFRCAV